MKKLFFLLLWAGSQLVQAGEQENMFRERVIIRVKDFEPNADGFKLQYLDPKKAEFRSDKKLSVISGNVNGQEVTFTQKESKPDYDKGLTFDENTDTLSLQEFKCDFSQKEDVLILYPWTFTDVDDPKKDKKNSFFEDNTLYINYGARNQLSLPYRGGYFGLVTIPFKVFMASKTELVDNFQFDVNLNFVLAYKIGKVKFSYIPGDEEGRSYVNAFSFGGLIGLNKVDLTKENIQDTTRSGAGQTMLTGSVGGVVGYHYKKFSAFLSMGIDLPFSSTGHQQWIYRYRPWVGFGVGFELF